MAECKEPMTAAEWSTWVDRILMLAQSEIAKEVGNGSGKTAA